MNTALSENERELVHQLLEDTRSILETPKFPRPSPAIVRTIFAPVLRRWIVERNFFAAQKLILPREIKFEVAINGNAAKLCKCGYYEHWMAVVLFGEVGVSVSQLTPEFVGGKPPPFSLGEFRQLPHPANAFFRQKMFFWKGRFYSRHDIIYFHANKLGGVHLDFKRAPDEAHIDEIKNYFGLDGEAHPLRMMRGSDIAAARSDPNRRPNIYDAIELITLDTARIFAKGIETSAPLFKALLQ